jgi:hypothetical protein
MGTFRACCGAPSATDTLFGEEHDLWFKMDAFGVLAPKTVKRTTFEENDCSYARAIMN